MDTNKMRDAFEAALAKQAAEDGFAKPSLRRNKNNGDYVDPFEQAAWWGWKASRAATGWQPMDSCPKHVEVLFFREDCGVISGQLTCADTFMTDKDRESGDYSEDEQYSEDAWCYGPDGVERLDGDLVPTHWMPYPTEPEVTP